MPNVENTTCERCGGCGLLDEWGYAMEQCPDCNSTIQELSIVPPHNTLEDFSLWIQDGCAEGVSGMAQDAAWLLSTVKQSLTVQEQACSSITLLYTHGLLTSAMRDHARKKLANL